MSKRLLPCPPAPGPLQDYAARFDDLFATLAHREEGGSASTCEGCCCPEIATKPLPPSPERSPSSKPSKSALSAAAVLLVRIGLGCASRHKARRQQLLGQDSVTRAHEDGVLIIDETADRKDGKKSAYVCGASVPELRGQDRQRYRVGFERVGLP